jgi:hypothetical protein
MSFSQELEQRAREYVQRHGLALGDKLGSGVQGIVYLTESQPQKGVPPARSAIKVLHQEQAYCRERDIYLRLELNGVTSIYGCEVPQLIRYDDTLFIIEMSVVAQPFVLDFGGAYIDEAPPDFPEEVMADWRAQKVEQFGSRWHEVEAIIHFLRRFDIYLVDVTPNNIVLPEK